MLMEVEKFLFFLCKNAPEVTVFRPVANDVLPTQSTRSYSIAHFGDGCLDSSECQQSSLTSYSALQNCVSVIVHCPFIAIVFLVSPKSSRAVLVTLFCSYCRLIQNILSLTYPLKLRSFLMEVGNTSLYSKKSPT